MTGPTAESMPGAAGRPAGDYFPRRNRVPQPASRAGALQERFVVPPFSVLDTRQGYWQDRRRAWLALGIRSELGRGRDVTDGAPDDARHLTGYTPRANEENFDFYRNRERQVRAAIEAGATPDQADALRAELMAQLPGSTYTDPEQFARIAASSRFDGHSRMLRIDLMRGEQSQVEAARAAVGEGYSHAPAAVDQVDAESVAMFDTDDEGDGVKAAPGSSIFDPVLCELMYRWFAFPGATVLDPFAGGSVRGITASFLGHPYTGVDLSAAQIAANREQAATILQGTPAPTWYVGDSRDLSTILPAGQTFDMLLTCPPYFDLETYSDDPRDLSTASTYEGFLQAYREILAHAVGRLHRDRFAVVVVSEVRSRKAPGTYLGLVPDTIAAMTAAGARFYNEGILLNSAGSMPLRMTKQFNAGRKLGRVHQNVLIFVKGSPPDSGTWSVDRDAPPDPQLSLFADDAPARPERPETGADAAAPVDVPDTLGCGDDGLPCGDPACDFCHGGGLVSITYPAPAAVDWSTHTPTCQAYNGDPHRLDPECICTDVVDGAASWFDEPNPMPDWVVPAALALEVAVVDDAMHAAEDAAVWSAEASTEWVTEPLQVGWVASSIPAADDATRAEVARDVTPADPPRLLSAQQIADVAGVPVAALGDVTPAPNVDVEPRPYAMTCPVCGSAHLRGPSTAGTEPGTRVGYCAECRATRVYTVDQAADPMIVTLTEADLAEARSVAESWARDATARGRSTKFDPYGVGRGSQVDSDAEAIAAEIAAARVTGLHRNTGQLPAGYTRADKGARPDLSQRVEVRSSRKAGSPLHFYPNDSGLADRGGYGLLVVGRLPTFRVVGWIAVADGMVERYQVKPGTYPHDAASHAVPQSALHPLPLPEDA